MSPKKKPARTIDIAVRFPHELRGIKERFRKQAAVRGLDMNALTIQLILAYLGDVDPILKPGSRPG